MLVTTRTIVQQSHHCGIETLGNSEHDCAVSRQQSHHCGIETQNARTIASTTSRQQSHHCGIETSSKASRTKSAMPQQSHHCGIETLGSVKSFKSTSQSSNRTIVGLKPYLADNGVKISTTAAIAPLWD